MKDISSILINILVMGFIVYGFVTLGSKISTFGIIINSVAATAVIFSTYTNIKNIKNKKSGK
ncbi:hypothetical protein P8V03_14380 [Clostridium sp. A1-XYC3]|uniref:Uncharacterized protein n=1 Tax=Clostridium tanneri TaxID=3037988 RepID=A0ABU4JW19_9CLOT|nr:hypothetical protein [Clostridium sp. A1-XYC3]MDW8802338.1 hypothetical protein [Clostridium sp. A1-XYC3]